MVFFARYRLLTAGTVEEKIYQRQLAKEGLQAVVDDKPQANAFDAGELRDLFTLDAATASDTHRTSRPSGSLAQ